MRCPMLYHHVKKISSIPHSVLFHFSARGNVRTLAATRAGYGCPRPSLCRADRSCARQIGINYLFQAEFLRKADAL